MLPSPSTNSNKVSGIAAYDGMLASFPNNEFYIDHTLDLNLADKYLGETVQMGNRGSRNEQGIRSTYRAIERYTDGDQKSRSNKFVF